MVMHHNLIILQIHGQQERERTEDVIEILCRLILFLLPDKRHIYLHKNLKIILGGKSLKGLQCKGLGLGLGPGWGWRGIEPIACKLPHSHNLILSQHLWHLPLQMPGKIVPLILYPSP